MTEQRETILLKTVTSVDTEQGSFEAVISTGGVDREKDIVSPSGMVRALHRWVPAGKKIPLAWDHSRAPSDQIGYVDPTTVRQVGDEVLAKGWLDLTTERGKDAFRLCKLGTLGFSFGYIVLQGKARPGGGRQIDDLDVYEITATQLPMNADTRVLSWKAVALPDINEQRDEAEAIADASEEQRVGDEPALPPEPPARPVAAAVLIDPKRQDAQAAAIRREQRQADERRVGETPAAPPASVAAAVSAPVPIDGRTQDAQAAAVATQDAAYAREQATGTLPPAAPAEPASEPVRAPESRSQRSRARRIERRERRQAEEDRVAGAAKSLAPVEAKAASDVGPAARAHLSSLIKYYMAKPHPFTSCQRDNVKRFGEDGANRVCATLKDIGAGTTHWRHGGGKAVPNVPDPVVPDALVTQLYDAADGDLENLLEMWFEHAEGDDLPMMYGAPTADVIPDPVAQRAKAARYAREQQEDGFNNSGGGGPLLSITAEEMDGLAGGELKAVWSAAMVNDLPDTAFLHIEAGGKKDVDGKTTPRTLRRFPIHDATGIVDLPHVQNALARIPQSDLPAATQERLISKAQKAATDFSQKGAMIASTQMDETDRGSNARSVDPLRNEAERVALEYASDGESLRKPSAHKAVPTPHPQLPLDELRRRSRDEMLSALTGGEEHTYHEPLR